MSRSHVSRMHETETVSAPRRKRWSDVEDMQPAATLDIDRVSGVLVRYLGAGDVRIDRLRTLAPPQ